ncbi:ammonium transporter [Dendrosporobacter sp. 1207_IL3150]|uniref:ammonium transporter n=1 Tax=Dendrosporobacter sp. 1207_IL3150 TaxID=3084054 RepID=UPI002FDB7FEA
MEQLAINAGDTTFVLMSAALVMFMIPGVAFFYAGMVGQKNVLNTLTQVLVVLAVVSIEWALFGYSLAFGTDRGGLIGDLSMLGLNGVGFDINDKYAPTIPHMAFLVFQMMFAVITPALISGSIVERMRFPAFVVFTLLWSTLVYNPLAHWVWGVGGWLREMGALDFAGGTVVHISSGVAGLVACIMLGKRKKQARPHHLPMAVLGAAMLWFGWFGFNSGSALAANSLAASAFLVTHLSAAAGAGAWLAAEYIHTGKPSLLGLISGAIAGLVAITPAAGFVTSMSSIAIGLISGFICYASVAILKVRLGYDDSLDAFGIHGIGGIWGAVATGLFATTSVNSAGADGLFYGNSALMLPQLVGVIAAAAFSGIATFAIIKVMSAFMAIRVESTDESGGLDISEHGQEAYDLTIGTALPVINERPLAWENSLENSLNDRYHLNSNLQ